MPSHNPVQVGRWNSWKPAEALAWQKKFYNFSLTLCTCTGVCRPACVAVVSATPYHGNRSRYMTGHWSQSGTRSLDQMLITYSIKLDGLVIPF